ncbi:MerR family transcriptional regulator [Streptomyces sp. NPDC058287]|uniref:MerR family transcriptional regulator n=1 Tax=unclassified Streptomyces TaxID=2593676 RepID=UPI0036E222CE
MTVIDSAPAKAPHVTTPLDVCVAVGANHPRPDGQDRYAIREVAAFTGLSAPTLRWYEEIGLMPRVQRTHTGQRIFDNRDLDWLTFVGKLRMTGMPTAEMVRFAELVQRGEETYAERRQILADARRNVLARIADLQGTLTVLDAKIDFYADARQATERA